MVLLKLLIFTLTFYALIVHLDAKICPKGQRVTRDRAGCDACPDGFYQPEDNDSLQCRVCTTCNKRSGSDVKEECTKETDRKCQCRGGFVARDSDSSTCKCDIGFGLAKNGECLQCQDGYFSNRINSICQKWKKCHAGVNINGTKTSDVTCNVEPTISPYITTAPTSNKILSLMTHLTSRRPHDGAGIQRTHATTTTTTTSGPRDTVTPKKEVQPLHPPNTVNHLGMVLLICGIVGLLVVLTAVTCKQHITPRGQRKTAVQTQDSLCGRPVEESGSDSPLSSLKLYPGEP